MSMAMPEGGLCVVATGGRTGEFFSMVWRQ